MFIKKVLTSSNLATTAISIILVVTILILLNYIGIITLFSTVYAADYEVIEIPSQTHTRLYRQVLNQLLLEFSPSFNRNKFNVASQFIGRGLR